MRTQLCERAGDNVTIERPLIPIQHAPELLPQGLAEDLPSDVLRDLVSPSLRLPPVLVHGGLDILRRIRLVDDEILQGGLDEGSSAPQPLARVHLENQASLLAEIDPPLLARIDPPLLTGLMDRPRGATARAKEEETMFGMPSVVRAPRTAGA